MKKAIFMIAAFMICAGSGFSQEREKARFGIQASYGKPNYIPSYADGAPSFDGMYFFDIGFLYLKPISEKWEFETGLVYSNNQFRVTPSVPFGLTVAIYNSAMNYWIVPANFRLWIPHRFFLQAGPNLVHSANESFGFFRLGFSLGVGKEFNLSDKHSLMIAPTINANPFFPTNWDGMTQLGIKTVFVFAP
ncbi:hypothetical protein A33Q_3770 [Indibacter alkaliphilus LW1]|uniref:Outer membrane protein beta-barrel domain-containing protein n=1 Tax=Indibacter alkaliphilus (strain CCUG 57479 / KCTC 22604 / LW1) TaxID=1189612 RepID=S2D7Z8_INDAL|nr:hypothetical protein [Indibacter alkaliphilus]EOZ93180.1 hypothetical protein A33Q_3770 [Indibacter alkaliphilus LW1]